MARIPTALAALALAFASGSAAAQQLYVICSVQADWCNLAAVEFEKATGIKAAMTLKGSGEAFAQIARQVWAEKQQA